MRAFTERGRETTCEVGRSLFVSKFRAVAVTELRCSCILGELFAAACKRTEEVLLAA